MSVYLSICLSLFICQHVCSDVWSLDSSANVVHRTYCIIEYFDEKIACDNISHTNTLILLTYPNIRKFYIGNACTFYIRSILNSCTCIYTYTVSHSWPTHCLLIFIAVFWQYSGELCDTDYIIVFTLTELILYACVKTWVQTFHALSISVVLTSI